MTQSKAPPVPPENRSQKGVGEPAQPEAATQAPTPGAPDSSKQGQQGNVEKNLTPRLKNQDR